MSGVCFAKRVGSDLQVHEREVWAIRIDTEAVLEEVRGGFGGVEEDDRSSEDA